MSFTNINQLSQFQNITFDGARCEICTGSIDENDTLLGHGVESHFFHSHCVEALLKVYDNCPHCGIEITHINGQSIEEFRGDAGIDEQESNNTSLITAATQGNFRKVEQLMKRAFDDEVIENALLQTVSHGDRTGSYGNVVRTLLLNSEITERTRGKAVLQASMLENTMILQYLLADGEIEESYRGRAVNEAAERDDLEKVQMLLDHGAISDDDRGSALIWTTNHEIMKAVIQSGNIDEEDASMALIIAVENDDLTAVELLLDNRTFEQENREHAFLEAIKANHIGIASVIYRNGPISPQVWAEAVQEAANLGYNNLYAHLMPRRSSR